MATMEVLNVKELYSRAIALMSKGRGAEALALFNKILEQNQELAEVHFQISRILLRNNHLDKALASIRRASELKPQAEEIWTVYSDVVRTLSHKDAQASFRAALKKAPIDKRSKKRISNSVDFVGKSTVSLGGTRPDVFERMVGALTGGRAKEAEQLATVETRRNPNSAGVKTVLAASLLAQGQIEAAEKTIAEALAIDRAYAEAHSTHARILMARRRIADSLHACNRALRLAPGMQAALRLRAECYKELRFPDEACRDYEALISLAPENAEYPYLLARLLFEERLHLDAERVARKALGSGMNTFGLHNVLAQALSDLGREAEALQQLEAGRHLTAGSAAAETKIAELLQSLGQFDEAEAMFMRAIECNPNFGETYRIYLTSKKLASGDPLIETMKTHFNDLGLEDKSRANFGFALAKAMEDQRRYDQVFGYLDTANSLMRKCIPYNIKSRIKHTDRLIASYRTMRWTNAPVSRCVFAPIFVTGMPRSGTTLVEQIIASHSRVTGAGEVGIAPGRAMKLLGREGSEYRDTNLIAPEAFQAFGEDFESYMRSLRPNADLLTDKSIQTFSYLGLMKLAMPEARFVVVRRDPRDNLLSIYKNVFPEGTHGYAYNVEDLAEYYRQFVRMVDFWREVVPDWFYEVQYEDLVANPAEEVPKLIAACGLDWEDACLEFHKNERRVKTLSVYQVRQPMYKSSTRAWERYGEDIRPLLDALGPEYSGAAE